MKYQVFLALLSCAAAIQRCPDASWSLFEGKCYKVSPTLGPYTAAAELCHQLDPSANMTSIHDSNENGHVKYLLDTEPGWIGLNRLDGGDFVWSDDTPVDFLYWDEGQPGQQACVIVNGNNVTGGWRTADYASRLNVVCETASITACPDGWSKFEELCYWHSNHSVKGTSLAAECYSLDPPAQPVSVHSLQLNTFLDTLAGGAAYPWIGLTRDHQSGAWTWLDAADVDYLNWDADYPTDAPNCAAIYPSSNGQWRNFDCSSFGTFFCQLRP